MKRRNMPLHSENSSQYDQLNTKIEQPSPSKKWVIGAIGVVSALLLGVAFKKGLPLFQKANASNKLIDNPSSKLSEEVETEFRLIERIDEVLLEAHIQGIEVYINQRKVMLVGSKEKVEDLFDARDLLKALRGVESVQLSIKADAAVESSFKV